MITPNEKTIAEAMCVTSRMLYGESRHLINDLKSGQNQPSLNFVIGRGKATHHKRRSKKTLATPSHHEITFGLKMITAHLTEDIYRWRTTREMAASYTGRNGTVDIFNKEITPLNVLSHVICHEFAHYVQVANGGRFTGSVHNDNFYREMVSLYDQGLGDKVRDFLARQFERLGVDLDVMKMPIHEKKKDIGKPASREGLLINQSVSFKYKGKITTGVLIKKNQIRAKVDVPNIGLLTVPYALFIKEEKIDPLFDTLSDGPGM